MRMHYVYANKGIRFETLLSAPITGHFCENYSLKNISDKTESFASITPPMRSQLSKKWRLWKSLFSSVFDLFVNLTNYKCDFEVRNSGVFECMRNLYLFNYKCQIQHTLLHSRKTKFATLTGEPHLPQSGHIAFTAITVVNYNVI